MMDVVEEVGYDSSRRCYWDFGRWSDLWRVWRRVGEDLLQGDVVDLAVRHRSSLLLVPDHDDLCLALPCPTVQEVLKNTAAYEDALRWARTLADVVMHADQLCPSSTAAAYAEITSRLQVSFGALAEQAQRLRGETHLVAAGTDVQGPCWAGGAAH